jgi:tetratricopeptide (TPR) repeat protein
MPLELNRASGVGPAQVLGAAIVAGWGVAAWRARRAYPVSSFGLAWVAVTLFPVSNLAVPIGTLLAERTLFSPSVGALLAIAGLAPWIAARAEASPPWQQRAALTLVAAVLLLFAWRSATRATVWHDDDVLYRQTVLDAPLSYRAHATLGRILFQEGDPGAGEREYRTAIRLYPYDPTVFAGLADHYRAAGLCGPAIPLFRQALDLAPGLGLARTRLIQCLIQVGDLTAAQEELAEKERRKEPDAALLRAAVDSLAGSFRGRPQ